MQPEAYDLENFADRPLELRSRLRVEKGGAKPATRQTMEQLRLAAVIAILLGLVLSVLYSQATVTELTRDIQTTQSELADAESEYDYLSSVLAEKTNMKNVEQVATSQLGLMKLDKSQITYIDLEQESIIARSQSNLQKAASLLEGAALSLFGFYES